MSGYEIIKTIFNFLSDISKSDKYFKTTDSEYTTIQKKYILTIIVLIFIIFLLLVRLISLASDNVDLHTVIDSLVNKKP